MAAVEGRILETVAWRLDYIYTATLHPLHRWVFKAVALTDLLPWARYLCPLRQAELNIIKHVPNARFDLHSPKMLDHRLKKKKVQPHVSFTLQITMVIVQFAGLPKGVCSYTGSDCLKLNHVWQKVTRPREVSCLTFTAGATLPRPNWPPQQHVIHHPPHQLLPGQICLSLSPLCPAHKVSLDLPPSLPRTVLNKSSVVKTVHIGEPMDTRSRHLLSIKDARLVSET